MTGNAKLWKMAPHTKGKHLVLHNYLKAWLPIRGLKNQRILFIDGFAGPGRYAGGEDGSPIIALRSHIEHAHRERIPAQVRYIFIEEDPDSCVHLQELINELKPQLPQKCIVENVIQGRFDERMEAVLDQLDQQAKSLAPAFVMIDPFGVSQTPISVIGRIMRASRSEVYISFMYEWINRFFKTGDFDQALDALYGCPDWRAAITLSDPSERREFLHNLYRDQLKAAGVKNIVQFRLYRENRHVYTLFFATNSNDGCNEMKEAMWKVAPINGLAFRGSRALQLDLGLDKPDFGPLRKLLVEEFSPRGWVRIEDIEEFVKSDRTEYHLGQLRRSVLIPMEDAGELEADSATRRKRRSFPSGTILRILPDGQHV